MSKMRVHAVLGHGSSDDSEDAIREALTEVVRKGDTIGLPFTKPVPESVEWVLDYIRATETPFVLYYNDEAVPPRLFRESEYGVVQKVRNPDASALKAVENGGKVLFLWDDDEEDEQVEFVFDGKPDGSLVLALNKGLAPISLEDEIPEPSDPEVEDEEEEDDTKFTRGELENMQAAAVKRYGTRMGCKGKTKGEIIAELFPEDTDTEEAVDDEAEVVTPTIDKTLAPPEHPIIRSLTNITPSPQAITEIESLRTVAKHLAYSILATSSASREQSLALTHLEETVMWAVKAICLQDDADR